MASDRFFEQLHREFTQAAEQLNTLDAAIGDGDHGTTMLRGLTKAVSASDGMRAKAFMRASGGASGTLFGLILLGIEDHIDQGAAMDAAAQAGKPLPQIIAAAAKGRDGTRDLVAQRGRAQYVENGGKGHIDPGSVSVVMILEALFSTEETP